MNLSTSLGFKQRTESDHQKYLVNSATVAVGRRMNRKSNLLLGLDGFYDRSLRATLGWRPPARVVSSSCACRLRS